MTPDAPEEYVVWRAVFGSSNTFGYTSRYELTGTPYNGNIRLTPMNQPVPMLDLKVSDAEDLIVKLNACVAFMRKEMES
jgi:hypothetical protein